MPNETREAIYQRILEGFTAVSRHCRQRDFPEELQSLDLTMAQMKAIWFLQQGAAHMSRIASALGVALPSATATVERLVQRSLVVRNVDPADRRLVVCTLTEKGQALARTFEEFQRTAFTDLLASLTEEQLQTVLQAVTILQKASSLPPREGTDQDNGVLLPRKGTR